MNKRCLDAARRLLHKKAATSDHHLAELVAFPGYVLGAGLIGGHKALQQLPNDEPFVQQHKDKIKVASSVAGGLGIAALAAELAGPLVAALTPTRTTEEQEQHDQGSAWTDWLVPGVAGYNHWKRVGRAIADDREQEALAAVLQQMQ